MSARRNKRNPADMGCHGWDASRGLNRFCDGFAPTNVAPARVPIPTAAEIQDLFTKATPDHQNPSAKVFALSKEDFSPAGQIERE